MKETYLGERNRNIVVYLLVIQVSICINPITKSQYAFNAEDAPTKEERGVKHKELMIFADRTPNLLLAEVPTQHNLREQRTQT